MEAAAANTRAERVRPRGIPLAWAVAAALLWHPLAGLAMLVVGPLTGLVALVFDRGVRLRREALNGWLRSTDARVVDAVRAGRVELCRLVEGALRDGSES